MTFSDDAILASARECLRIEQDALALNQQRLDKGFIETIRLLEATRNAGKKLVFTGVGKNVPVCLKLTGTFNSTAVPATFLDPNQALHGDLGLCREGDLCLLVSNSGETEDLLRLLPSLKRLGLTTVALTADAQSSLGRFCDHVLLYHYEREACPLNLAPTASTTSALAMGDALAMVYLELRGFTRDDFAQYHPAGSLGKALLLRVEEIMRTGGRFATAPDSVSVQEALLAITRARCGSIALCDAESGRLTGVFSDGDFRRAALEGEQILRQPVRRYMTASPKTVRKGALAVEALHIFEEAAVDDLVVLDEQDRPVGLIDGQDMPRLKLV